MDTTVTNQLFLHLTKVILELFPLAKSEEPLQSFSISLTDLSGAFLSPFITAFPAAAIPSSFSSRNNGGLEKKLSITMR